MSKYWQVGLLVMLLAGSASAVNAQNVAAQGQIGNPGIDRILEQLSGLEQRLKDIEKRLDAGTKPGEASAPAGTAADIGAQLESLDQAIRIVDRKREIDQEAAATRLAEAPVLAAGRDGFSIRSADSSYQLRVNGYFQADGRFYVGAKQVDTHGFLLRRIRPIIQGTLAKSIEFRITPDWGNGQAVLQEAHLDFRYFPKTSIRFGKFKSPIGLERLQSATDLAFTERALPTAVAPNRDVGIQVYGDLRKGAFSYAVGVLNGVPDGGSGDLDNNDGKDVEARVFVTPFVSRGADHPLNGLGVGLAVTDGRQAGASLPTYRTPAQSAFFSYVSGVTAAGNRRRFSPQGYYYSGSFGLMAEYVRADQNFQRGGVTNRFTTTAWETTASYFVTGEKKSYKTTTPYGQFEPGSGNAGAVELVSRIDRLKVDRSAFDLGFADPTRSARDALELAVGVNWHVARNNKLMLDYAHTRFYGGGSTGGDRTPERAILSRFQVAF